MDMRTRTIMHGMAILSVLVALSWTAGCRAPATPRLLADETVAPDLAELAGQTWDRFMRTFGSRSDCFGDVKLTTAKDLDSRAVYDSVTATVAVEVPATAALLKAALIHEWAHHVEFQCPQHDELRPDFLAAQSLPADSDWFAGSTWANTPSEQYAEAAVILVLGRRQLPTEAKVTPAAVEALAAWASSK